MIEELSLSDLTRIYVKGLGVNIDYLFQPSQTVLLYKECAECGLRYFDPPVAGDERFYNILQDYEWYYPGEKEEFRYAASYLKEDDHVLEIGSGRGAFSRFIKSGKYTGLELSFKAIEVAKKNGITIKKETIEEHASSNRGIYDAVCCFQVIEHVPNTNSFIISSLECLKQEGLLILSVPSADSFYSYAINNVLNLPPHHVSHWSDKSLIHTAKIHNLDVVHIHHEKVSEIHESGYIHTFVLNAFRNLFRLEKKLIDTSIRNKILDTFSIVVSKLLRHGLVDEMKPNGHTVIAVYRKK